MPNPPSAGPPNTTAFLLTQLGTFAASRFAERATEIGLTPPECGVLGLLGARTGLSQQQLAETLGMIPSRVVPLVDRLEDAGLVKRVRDASDRRRNALELTDAGRDALAAVGRIGKAHDDEMTSALSATERRRLHELLQRVAQDRGLVRGVHPGYGSLDPSRERSRRTPA